MTYGGCFRQGSKVLAVLGYCIGSLFDLFETLERGYSEEEIRALTFQTLSGLQYLHNTNIVHRDLKCGNIMLTMEGQAVISDFGVSALLDKRDQRCHTFVGSPFWIAPEVITAMARRRLLQFCRHLVARDHLIECADTVPPHFEMSAMSALFHIPDKDPPTLKADPTKNWSDEFHEFLDNCLQKTPDDRWSADMLMAHPLCQSAQAQAKASEVHPVKAVIILAREKKPVEIDFSLAGLKNAFNDPAIDVATATPDVSDAVAQLAQELDFVADEPSDRKITHRDPTRASNRSQGRPPLQRPFSLRKPSNVEDEKDGSDEESHFMKQMRQKSMKNPARSKSRLRKKAPSDTFA